MRGVGENEKKKRIKMLKTILIFTFSLFMNCSE
jgi:hypothetical protein